MGTQKLGKLIFLLAVSGLILVLAARESAAVPSFYRQTGMDCSVCHTMFPELTQVGRAFKLTGYVLNKQGAKYQPYPPLAAMAFFSYTHMNSGQAVGAYAPDIWSRHSLVSDNNNDVIGSPQQFTLLYGGQIYDKVGAFIQGTYLNTSNKMTMDNSDIRYANSTQVCGKDLIFGVTVNNDPTVEDVWNTTPAFSFPYATSNIAPSPIASPLITSLGAQVGGAGLYAYWNNLIYATVSVYRTSENGITLPFGSGNHPLAVQVDGALPYWRVALTRQYGAHSFEIGTFGLSADTFVGAVRGGPTDHFWDAAVDAQYQYIHDKHSFSVQTSWIFENENRSGSFASKAAANTSDSLDAYRINGNYYYRTNKCGTIGGTVGFFSITGSTDPLLYAPAAFTGSRYSSPNSNGVILELDYMPPWKYLFTKLTAQYVIYNEFNGASTNYDGFGRNASGNNTLYLLAWLAF
jgi:hypothetical protein